MNPMTKAERIKLLEECLARLRQMDDVNKTLIQLFNGSFEAPAHACFYDLFIAYSRLVSEKVGDDSDWLGWFIFDNDCGKKALEAKAGSWKKARKIRTVKDLEAIISAK